MMLKSYLKVVTAGIICFGLVSILTSQMHWGILAGLLIGIGGAKWVRLEKQKAADEIEYDERVNHNIQKASLEIFSASHLLLLVFLLISVQILNETSVKANYLIVYICVTFVTAFYIIPLIARKK